MSQEMRREIVGENLREWREKAGRTQADVATHLGYTSPQFVSNWERGVSLPPLDVLPVLSRLYKVKPTSLIAVFEKLALESAEQRLAELERAFKRHRS